MQLEQSVLAATVVTAVIFGAGATVLEAEVPEATVYDLRLRPHDKVYELQMTSESTMTMNLGQFGGQQQIDSEAELMMSMSIRAVDDSEDVEVESATRSIAVTVSQGGEPLATFNSGAATDAQDVTSRMFRAMTENPVIVRLSRRGEVRSIEGLDQLLEAIQQHSDAAGDATTAAMLAQMFSEDTFTQNWQTNCVYLPPGPVSLGDSWSNSFEQTNPAFGSATVATRYTAVGERTIAGERCLELETAVEMSFDFESDLVQQLAAATGGTIDVDIEDTAATGTACVSLASGLTLAADLEMPMQMQFDLDPGRDAEGSAPLGNAPMSMEIVVRSQLRPVD